MRTSIEIEDQLYNEIKQRARSSSRSIREVIESALRAAFMGKGKAKKTFTVKPHYSKFKAGIDENHLKQILDELDIEGHRQDGDLQ